MKIAIVNDLRIIAEALRRIIVHAGEHEIAWIARSGEEALRLCAAQRPDLILMDLVMPGMDGVETTRQIMRQSPCAILLVTASPDANTAQVFRALGAGALDVVATPVMSAGCADDSALLAKIRTLNKLIRAETAAAVPLDGAQRGAVGTLVAIGASTGGPAALARVLSHWKPGPDTAVVIIQHIDRAFTDSLATWLGNHIGTPVDVIQPGARPLGGRIFIAKTNDHLQLHDNGAFAYESEPRDYPYRPSIDVFFHALARRWPRQAVGVLLTGMGRDGAEGLLAMRRRGMPTIAQDQASSTVYGMPRAAAAIDAAERILPLDEIGPALQALTKAS